MHSMKDVKRILVGVTPNDDAQVAFDVAIERAKELGATLVITSILDLDELNVYEVLSEDYLKKHQAALEEQVQKYSTLAREQGVKHVEAVVGQGKPGEVIVKEILPAANIDLIMVGSATKTGLKKHFGSQAAYIAKYAPVSVLVIR
ncbi:universal stress protein [Ligilactobacillus ceti]|uniref:Universal stress protein n=1 Tax=Ligilactobacillus ceti DSM 22408 TaxID=1122146 RepID=A0A0R2KS34_9LACO|nr:universal stress protein [Ligilactobacillus ceti]KRN90566.1 universal stress protein [Ligilactobacillus ceti DSM 22408]